MDIPWERQNTLVHAIEILVAESKLFMHLRQVESIHELRWLDQGMSLKSYLVHSMAWYVGISKPTEVIQVSPSKPLDCQRKHRPKENSQPMTFPSSFTQKSCLRKKDFNSSLDWWAMTLLHSEVKISSSHHGKTLKDDEGWTILFHHLERIDGATPMELLYHGPFTKSTFFLRCAIYFHH